ncbi:hypothetical protein pdul_cds_831 [Pandoravirus dulcis]|uniref:Uncharacterized protein n=1 Tax=Pandoravirus dulcis TaxID=1349409 RepID=S4VYB3_9VIRU|nr:hypothetical protein pdul_cds_831 [Pandoravirus dulcis]AGO83041.1 hypothetical protein pdul_cds_831 [Pandoravirus dulcis]
MDQETDHFGVWMLATLSRRGNTLAATDEAPSPKKNAPRPYGTMDALTSHMVNTGRAVLFATGASDDVNLTLGAIMRTGLGTLDVLYADRPATLLSTRSSPPDLHAAFDGPFWRGR